jgi:hypothetical protein
MKQPCIKGKQARWLVHLTSYDFIIRHRRGLSNLANRLLRRPGYMAKAPREPSLVQKDLLANKLKTRPDSDRPRATKPDFLLCEVAKCRLCKIAEAMSDFLLYKVTKCRLYKIAEAMSDFLLCEVAKCRLYKIAKAMSDLPLCEVAKCQLYKVAKAVSDIQPCDTVRPKLDYTVAGS